MEFGSKLRSKYADAASCACVIDGQIRPPDRISKRTMNFGQHWRTEGVVDVDYRIELPRALLFDFLSRELPELIADCKAHPDPECALDSMLRTANWPDAGDVMARPELTQFFAEYLAGDLLLHWFGDAEPEGGFVLNTVDKVGASGGRVITLEGKARPTGMPVRYQDV